MQHYEGKLGDFDYNDDMYEIKNGIIIYDTRFDHEYLHFKNSYVGPIDLPDGCTDCSYMFLNCNIKDGCYIRNFDTLNVSHKLGMFDGCRLPDKFFPTETHSLFLQYQEEKEFEGKEVPKYRLVKDYPINPDLSDKRIFSSTERLFKKKAELDAKELNNIQDQKDGIGE